jgi:hypothetical protein
MAASKAEAARRANGSATAGRGAEPAGRTNGSKPEPQHNDVTDTGANAAASATARPSSRSTT